MKTQSNYKTGRRIATGVMVLALVMMQLNVFASGNKRTTAANDLNTTDTEEIYSLENWMTSLNNWVPGEEEKKVITENEKTNSALESGGEAKLFDAYDLEEEVQVEEWMTDTNHEFWTNPDFQIDNEQEPELEVWMSDLTQW